MSTQSTIVIPFITFILVDSRDCGPNAVSTCITKTLFPTFNSPKILDIKGCGPCVCKTNYVRNTDGKCQPKECPANSSFKICREINDKHQCVGPITTNIDGPSAADCVCDPGYYWFNEFEGCMILVKLLERFSYESRPRLG